MPELDRATVLIGKPGLNGGGVTTTELNTAVADRAPASAKYIVQTADAGLTNEQALSTLSTGLLKVTTGTGVLSTATGTDVPSHTHTGVVGVIEFIIDGGGAVITTGVKGDLYLPIAVTLTEATLIADQTGSIQIDIWREAYNPLSSGPVDANSITGSTPPNLVSQSRDRDQALTGWTTVFGLESHFRFNVDSCSTITRCLVALKFTRSI